MDGQTSLYSPPESYGHHSPLAIKREFPPNVSPVYHHTNFDNLHSPSSVSSSSNSRGFPTSPPGKGDDGFYKSPILCNGSLRSSPESDPFTNSRLSRRDMAMTQQQSHLRIQETEISTSTLSPQKAAQPQQQPQQRTRRTRKKSPTVVMRMKKFRRIKANDRERHRMHLLNGALERLRLVLPSMPQDQRLTKIETLRFAYNYIWALSGAVKVIKNLSKSSSSPSTHSDQEDIIEGGVSGGNKEEMTMGGSSFVCELVDGNYVVRVGNVRIVLDQEGSLVETLATRPSTPQPQEYQHDLQTEYHPSDEDSSSFNYHLQPQFFGNDNEPNVYATSFNSARHTSVNTFYSQSQQQSQHSFHSHHPFTQIDDEQPPHVRDAMPPISYQKCQGLANYTLITSHQTNTTNNVNNTNSQSPNTSSNPHRHHNQHVDVEVDCSSNYSFASSFEDETDALSLSSPQQMTNTVKYFMQKGYSSINELQRCQQNTMSSYYSG